MATGGKSNDTRLPLSQGTSGFGQFCVELASYLEASTVITLATVFEFTLAEMDNLERLEIPAPKFIRMLKSKAIITATDITKLVTALRINNLEGIVNQVQTSFDRNVKDQGSDAIPSADEVNEFRKVITRNEESGQTPQPILRSDYQFLSDKMFEKYRTNQDRLAFKNEDAKEEYEDSFGRYTLEENLDCESCISDVEDIRVVMIGKTGSGKSATANTILGQKRFQEGGTSKSETTDCCLATCRLPDGRQLRVADAPGLKDTNRSDEDIMKEMARVAFLLREGVHVFIIVWNASDIRFTEEARSILLEIERGFANFKDHCLLVYSNVEGRLRDISLDEYVVAQKEQQEMNDFLDEMGWRVAAVNNKTDIPAEKERNKRVLIGMINKMITRNGENSVYTNPLFDKATLLYEKVKKECNDCNSALVGAVVEAYGSYELSQLLRENEMCLLVFDILKRSKTGLHRADSQEWVLHVAEEKVTMETSQCERQICFIFRQLLGQVSSLHRAVYIIARAYIRQGILDTPDWFLRLQHLAAQMCETMPNSAQQEYKYPIMQ